MTLFYLFPKNITPWLQSLMTFKLFPSHQLKDKLTESLMERWTQILDLRNNERQERISLTMAHANVDVQNADPHSYNYSSLWQENTDVKTGSIIQSKVNPEKLHSNNFLHGPFSDILIPINFIFICPYLFGGKKKVRIILFTLGGKKNIYWCITYWKDILHMHTESLFA